MIVGFDVYHCGKRKGASVGALVATTNDRQSKYYSTVSTHGSREELSSNLCLDITSKFLIIDYLQILTKMFTHPFVECLNAFSKTNKDLPDRIIMYRDGVGEGQLGFVYETELKQIKVRYKVLVTMATQQLNWLTFHRLRWEASTNLRGNLFQNFLLSWLQKRLIPDFLHHMEVADEALRIRPQGQLWMMLSLCRKGEIINNENN